MIKSICQKAAPLWEGEAPAEPEDQFTPFGAPFWGVLSAINIWLKKMNATCYLPTYFQQIWDKYQSKKWLTFTAKFIAFFIVFHLIAFFVAKLFYRVSFHAWPFERDLLKFIIIYGCFIYCFHWYRLYEPKAYTLDPIPSFKHIWLIVFGLILGVCMHSVFLANRVLFWDVNPQWNPHWDITNCLQGFGTVILAAAAEEFLFRGFLLLLFRYLVGVLPALFISSFLFALAHFANDQWPLSDVIIMFLVYTSSGLFYGTAFLAAKTIWFPIALHAGWNWYSFMFNKGDSPLEWLNPLVIITGEDSSIYKSPLEIEWLWILLMKLCLIYFLIRGNKALYRTMRRYFRSS